MAVLTIGASNAQAVIIPGLFPTGVDAGGKVLPGTTIDPHYKLIASDDPNFPIPNAYVVATTGGYIFPPAWAGAPNTLTSAWISANPLQSGTAGGTIGNSPGTFIYRLTFTLAPDQDPTKSTISGNWAGDDISLIYLNGVYTGNTNLNGIGGFPTLKSFNIPAGPGPSLFVAGVNHLDFVVVNAAQGTTGLLVSDITGDGPIIPEPSSIVLSLLGGAGLGIAALRRRRASK